MNFIQFGLFAVFVFGALCAGAAVYAFLSGKQNLTLNRLTYLGEALLLGSMVIVAEMLTLSLVGFYRTPWIWGCVLVQFLFLCSPSVRQAVFSLRVKAKDIDPAFFCFLLFVVCFAFRNMFFMMDIDSHSYYLLAQKLWLNRGSSLVGDVATDLRIFSPSFNAVTYALGISLFPGETLFPQLIDLYWRIIVLILVFGYTRYRLNGWLGLAAVLLVGLNDHFLYSGVNKSVIINGAVTALLFAAAYNFVEASRKNQPFYFVLSLIFMTHFLANKYQFFYILLFLFSMGWMYQNNPVQVIRALFKNRTWLIGIGAAAVAAGLWFFKNYLATGVATFPILAGHFRVFNWTPEMHRAWSEASGILPVSMCLKYLSYMFIWPGVNPLKILLLVLVFFPAALMMSFRRADQNRDEIRELGYWLGVSVLAVVGMSLIGFADPRNYRYLIAVIAFAAVLNVDYIFRSSFGISRRFWPGIFLLAVALSGYKIIFAEGGSQGRPTWKNNLDVVLNRIHTADVVDQYYPYQGSITRDFADHQETTARSAWGGSFARKYSAFLSPIRPQINEWSTTVVRWDSFQDEALIVKDLRDFGIEYVMVPSEKDLTFVSVEEYAKEIAKFKRYPERIIYDYGFPDELAVIKR